MVEAIEQKFPSAAKHLPSAAETATNAVRDVGRDGTDAIEERENAAAAERTAGRESQAGRAAPGS